MKESITQLSFKCGLKAGESQASQEVQWEGWRARLRAIHSQSVALGWMYTFTKCHPTLIPKLQFHLTIVSRL